MSGMRDEKHVSLDIEACGEIVLSIGACEFDPHTGAALNRFYCVPSIADQLAKGLKPDAGALVWFLKQSPEARLAVADVQAPAEVELSQFCAWYARRDDAWCWAYPTSFDLPVIERACRAFGIRPPWKWTKTMDGRTLWRLACERNPDAEKIEKSANAAPHHALEDAVEQAKWYAAYMGCVLP